MIIKNLELQNFQVIKDFNYDFQGNVYFFTGDNELGKSTLLESIKVLLTGKRDNVLRNGESKGHAKMIIGDDGEEYEVSLSFTKANPRGTLTIKQATTGMKSTTVSMLQKIFGYTDFDAVEFSRWSETAEGRRKQIEIVKKLLPEKVVSRIDEIDNQVTGLKDRRADANRELKICHASCEAAAKGLTREDFETYAEPVDIVTLMEEQKKNAALSEKANTARKTLQTRKETLSGIPGLIDDNKKEYESKIEAAKKALAIAQKEYEESVKEAEEDYKTTLGNIEEIKKTNEEKVSFTEKWLADYDKISKDFNNIEDRLKNVQHHNEMNAKIVSYQEKKQKYNDVQKNIDEQNDKIKALAEERESLINGSSLPIKGLSFGEDGLILNDVPFMPGKVSDSQIMEIAVNLVMLSNPKAKIFTISRGESLGEKRLKDIIDIAKKNGFQGFIEEVRRGQDDLIVEEYNEKE